MMGEGIAHVAAVDHSPGRERTAWFSRPVIVFATAYIVITVIHESTHALTARALNVPFTLYPFAVDLARDGGTLTERAFIGVAGPLCALVVGIICWFSFRRARGVRAELLLLYLATFGAGSFFGNLMSAAFVGDFSRVAMALQLPAAARYAVSLMGLLSLSALMFAAGWELRRLSPAGSSRSRAMVLMIVLPAVIGTGIVTLASLPMPSALILGRLAETSFWVFSAAGLLVSRSSPSSTGRTLDVGWVDASMLTVAVIAVRLMYGISFQQ